MPGKASDEVPHRPAPSAPGTGLGDLTSSGGAKSFDDRLPGFRHRLGYPLGGTSLPAERTQITPVCLDYVPNDSIQLTATTSGPLAEDFPGGPLPRGIQRAPTGSDHLLQLVALAWVGARVIGRGNDARDTKIRGSVAVKALYHTKLFDSSGRLKAESGRTNSRRIAGTTVEKRLKRGRLIRAAPAPSWPRDRTGEDALRANLQIDVVFHVPVTHQLGRSRPQMGYRAATSPFERCMRRLGRRSYDLLRWARLLVRQARTKATVISR